MVSCCALNPWARPSFTLCSIRAPPKIPVTPRRTRQECSRHCCTAAARRGQAQGLVNQLGAPNLAQMLGQTQHFKHLEQRHSSMWEGVGTRRADQRPAGTVGRNAERRAADNGVADNVIRPVEATAPGAAHATRGPVPELGHPSRGGDGPLT